MEMGNELVLRINNEVDRLIDINKGTFDYPIADVYLDAILVADVETALNGEEIIVYSIFHRLVKVLVYIAEKVIKRNIDYEI